ncbi:MAG: hypothetical protein IPK82_06720 [Polyangiaceae bacterium]|nr:hypothetical protein [Polyangiaceae bacterium]
MRAFGWFLVPVTILGCATPPPALPGPLPEQGNVTSSGRPARIATDTDMAVTPGPTSQPVSTASPAGQVAASPSVPTSLALPFDKKRLVPFSTMMLPPERGADSMVWKTGVNCAIFGVYKGFIGCSSGPAISVYDADTGQMKWGTTIQGATDVLHCSFSDDGKVLFGHRTGNASNGYEPMELIVLNSADGSFLGAYSYRGNRLRATSGGFAFVQADYAKPQQVIMSDWKGNARLVAEDPPEPTIWVEVMNGEMWLMRSSKKKERSFAGTLLNWDGTTGKTIDPAPYGFDGCPGFSSYLYSGSRLVCYNQVGSALIFQSPGGPRIEHLGTFGQILDGGDIVRVYSGFLMRHKPVQIGPAPQKTAR